MLSGCCLSAERVHTIPRGVQLTLGLEAALRWKQRLSPTHVSAERAGSTVRQVSEESQCRHGPREASTSLSSSQLVLETCAQSSQAYSQVLAPSCTVGLARKQRRRLAAHTVLFLYSGYGFGPIGPTASQPRKALFWLEQQGTPTRPSKHVEHAFKVEPGSSCSDRH